MGYIDLVAVEAFFFYGDISEQQTLVQIVNDLYEDPFASVYSRAGAYSDGRVEWDGPSANYQIARPGESWITRGVVHSSEQIQATYRPAGEWTEPGA